MSIEEVDTINLGGARNHIRDASPGRNRRYADAVEAVFKERTGEELDGAKLIYVQNKKERVYR